jgi:hypothetical protein
LCLEGRVEVAVPVLWYNNNITNGGLSCGPEESLFGLSQNQGQAQPLECEIMWIGLVPFSFRPRRATVLAGRSGCDHQWQQPTSGEEHQRRRGTMALEETG